MAVPLTPPFDHAGSRWSVAAEAFLRAALAELERGVDPIPHALAAVAALRIEAGELPEDEDLAEEAGELPEDQ